MPWQRLVSVPDQMKTCHLAILIKFCRMVDMKTGPVCSDAEMNLMNLTSLLGDTLCTGKHKLVASMVDFPEHCTISLAIGGYQVVCNMHFVVRFRARSSSLLCQGWISSQWKARELPDQVCMKSD